MTAAHEDRALRRRTWHWTDPPDPTADAAIYEAEPKLIPAEWLDPDLASVLRLSPREYREANIDAFAGLANALRKAIFGTPEQPFD